MSKPIEKQRKMALFIATAGRTSNPIFVKRSLALFDVNAK
jgi:hypothetical protein